MRTQRKIKSPSRREFNQARKRTVAQRALLAKSETARVDAEDRGTAGTAEVATGAAAPVPAVTVLPEATGPAEPEVAAATRVAVFYE